MIIDDHTHNVVSYIYFTCAQTSPYFNIYSLHALCEHYNCCYANYVIATLSLREHYVVNGISLRDYEVEYLIYFLK